MSIANKTNIIETVITKKYFNEAWKADNIRQKLAQNPPETILYLCSVHVQVSWTEESYQTWNIQWCIVANHIIIQSHSNNQLIIAHNIAEANFKTHSYVS